MWYGRKKNLTLQRSEFFAKLEQKMFNIQIKVDKKSWKELRNHISANHTVSAIPDSKYPPPKASWGNSSIIYQIFNELISTIRKYEYKNGA